MESNLKRKHILSEYAVLPNNALKKTNLKEQNLIENKSRISLAGTTILTENIENSDSDECVVEGMTWETRGIETSDSDEVYKGPTKYTFTIEVSDEDEFYII